MQWQDGLEHNTCRQWSGMQRAVYLWTASNRWLLIQLACKCAESINRPYTACLLLLLQCCFSSTETISTVGDREPRVATSTFTQLLGSDTASLRVQGLSLLCFGGTQGMREWGWWGTEGAGDCDVCKGTIWGGWGVGVGGEKELYVCVSVFFLCVCSVLRVDFSGIWIWVPLEGAISSFCFGFVWVVEVI